MTKNQPRVSPGKSLLGMVPFAFSTLKLHRIEAACIPTNTPSIRVLEKCGLRAYGTERSFSHARGVAIGDFHTVLW